MAQQLYIVAWTGGYEMPSYVAKATLEEANVQAAEWLEDCKDEDTVEILVVNLDDLTIDRDEAPPPSPPTLTDDDLRIIPILWPQFTGCFHDSDCACSEDAMVQDRVIINWYQNDDAKRNIQAVMAFRESKDPEVKRLIGRMVFGLNDEALKGLT